MKATIDPKTKSWITVVVRIIVILLSALGGDAVEVLDIVSNLI